MVGRWVIATMLLASCAGTTVIDSVSAPAASSSSAHSSLAAVETAPGADPHPAIAVESYAASVPPGEDAPTATNARAEAEPTTVPTATARPGAATSTQGSSAEATDASPPSIADADESPAVGWCDGPAERLRIAFADTIWAGHAEGKTLEDALTDLLQTLVELEPLAPAELQVAFAIAIETQIELNVALAAAGGDKNAVDWRALPTTDRNEEATATIDLYGANTCGQRPGRQAPEDGSPGGRETNDKFEELVADLVARFDLDENAARCLAAAFFEFGVEASAEAREAIESCGVPAETLREIAGA